LYCIEDLAGLRRRSRRAVIDQSCPWRDQTIVWSDRVVVFLAEPASESASVLPVATPRQHRVDVQGIDLACESRSRSRICRRSLRQQDHQRWGVGSVVPSKSDSRRRCGEPRVEPELTHLRRIRSKQRRHRHVFSSCIGCALKCGVRGTVKGRPLGTR
jgi:hypothetical protein